MFTVVTVATLAQVYGREWYALVFQGMLSRKAF